EKKVTIEPKDAYGDVNPQAFVEYPKSRIPEGTPLEKGRVVDLVKDKSQIVKATIWEIQEENVLLNMNHPLAGKILDFDVKVVSIE
ncbi:MAG: peptidylprolyl isomerase, partial [Candidatus Omnitrophica bacterium CG12_big_fil_rev_8_21_14_0_65_50_5]